MKLVSKIIATFFGVGYFPIAPGTLTSLIVVFLYRLFLHELSWPIYVLFFFLLFFFGVFASSKYASELNKKDPRNIVIDEAAGQFLVLFRMSEDWFPLLLSFFLFRLFDIVKPIPIKKVENFPSGWGIMMDDLLAAIYAGVIVNIYLILR
ncbi:MAG: phosphatidylglycerophosphatase A [Candidatus Aminicenantes bacterium]|nr:MAG: phosphatidylglycerophosphatase A [Candidatus Aminicenantes bacterium]